MDLVDNLVGGIVSSLIAVVAVEGYLSLRNRLRERSLARTLGFSETSCTIVVSSHSFQGDLAEIMGVLDAIAVGRALALCARVQVSAELVSSPQAPNGLIDSNIISIGGWSGNSVTGSLMSRYCPGFAIVNRDKEWTDFDSVYYECGERTFKDSQDTMHAFIVKLSPKMTGSEGTRLLIWGHHGVATISGMHYLDRSHKELSYKRNESFFVALQVDRTLGYSAVARSFVDLSADAFG
jgi:hypothetical protein